jgi:hypothetical protein
VSTPAPQPEDAPDREPTFREAFGAAARGAGLGEVPPGEMPSPTQLLAAVGGGRGLVEAVLPGLAFLVLFTLTHLLALSVLVPVGIAAVFVVLRLLSRTPLTQAFAGIAGVALSAVFALVSGRPEDNFLPGIVINVVSLALMLLSIAVRYPLIGVLVGVLANEGLGWRKDRAKRRVLTLATALWAGLFGSRLLAEVPLYLAGEVEWLAGAKLVMGIPLYALVLWLTWLIVRPIYSSTSRPDPRAHDVS